MLVEAQIPTISRGIAVSEIKKYLLDPKGTVRETKTRILRENPDLLGHSIIGALGIMQSVGEKAALVHLKGGLYYYQCYSEEVNSKGTPVIRVSRATVQSIFQKNKDFMDTFNQSDAALKHQYLHEADDTRRAFSEALANTNSDFLACTRGFEVEEQSKGYTYGIDVETLVQGGIFTVHDALTQELNNPDLEESSDDRDSTQALRQPFLITASRASIRDCLVEIILDRVEFTQTSLRYLKQCAPNWDGTLDIGGFTTSRMKAEYDLFTSLVVGVYSREFNHQGVKFPPVSSNIIKGTLGIEVNNGKIVIAPNPEIRSSRAFEILKELETENNVLYNAYTALALARGFNPYSIQMPNVALFATTDAYALIKAQSEAEYWEEKSKV